MTITDPAMRRALADSWALLSAGAADRTSPMHVPVVATLGADGVPDQRIMVLRSVDQASATLRFNTDARSPKVAAVAASPSLSVLAYDADARVQLRLGGTAHVSHDEPETVAAWRGATAFARRCYLAMQPPGTALAGPSSGLPAAIEGRRPTEAELVPAEGNFAQLVMRITTIDYLHLAQAGHRRIVFRQIDASSDWSGCWVQP